MAEFAQGHQFLREREQHLLDQLARLEQELAEGREKCQARGSGELARLALVISELEGKAQQPAAELMQVRSLLGAGLGIGRQACPVGLQALGPRLSSLRHGLGTLLTHLFQWLLERKVRCRSFSASARFKGSGEGAVHT